jgi:hypothetical protein
MKQLHRGLLATTIPILTGGGFLAHYIGWAAVGRICAQVIGISVGVFLLVWGFLTVIVELGNVKR